MVNKKLLLGLIVIGGLQNVHCAQTEGAQTEVPLKKITKDFLPKDHDGYLESIIAGDDAALTYERNINQKLQEELDRLRQEIDVRMMEITSLKYAETEQAKQYQRDISDFQQQLTTGTDREAALNRQIDALTAEIEELQYTTQNRIQSLTDIWRDHSKRLEDSGTEITQLKEIIKQHEEDFKRFLAGRAKLVEKCKSLMKINKQQKKDIKYYSRQQDNLEELKALVDVLMEELENLKVTVKADETIIEKLVHEKVNLIIEIEKQKILLATQKLSA